MKKITWRRIDKLGPQVFLEGKDEEGNMYYTYDYEDKPGKKKMYAVVTKDWESGAGPTPEEALKNALKSEEK